MYFCSVPTKDDWLFVYAIYFYPPHPPPSQHNEVSDVMYLFLLKAKSNNYYCWIIVYC